jgi:hypothetical protein
MSAAELGELHGKHARRARGGSNEDNLGPRGLVTDGSDRK